jgi:hypothetical protein
MGLLSILFLPPSLLRADGGVVRLSEKSHGWRITVFTAPTPFRAGPVDISVLVQDAETGELSPDVAVEVRLTPRARPSGAVTHRATEEEATNKMYRAAVFELPAPGWWDVEVLVTGPRGEARLAFALEAAEPPPRWTALWPWIAWPAVVVLLFGVHQLLARRRGAREDV